MVKLMGLPAVIDSGYGLDGAQLGKAITLLSAQMNVSNHRLLRMIAEFDIHGGWRADGALRSCAHWLAANCGLAIGPAREKVRVARCLAGLPEVNQAFAEGELSYSKVRAITRVATPDNEGFMVCMAEQNSASHLEKLVGKYQPVEEPGLAGPLPEEGPATARRERDGVCQYPGCHESEYVDAHHIQHWAEGGETSLDNLVTLCRHHHRQLHRGCFDVRMVGVSAVKSR